MLLGGIWPGRPAFLDLNESKEFHTMNTFKSLSLLWHLFILLTVISGCGKCADRDRRSDAEDYFKKYFQSLSEGAKMDMDIFISNGPEIAEINQGELTSASLFGYVLNATPGAMREIDWPRTSVIRDEGSGVLLRVPIVADENLSLYFVAVWKDGAWKVYE